MPFSNGKWLSFSPKVLTTNGFETKLVKAYRHFGVWRTYEPNIENLLFMYTSPDLWIQLKSINMWIVRFRNLGIAVQFSSMIISFALESKIDHYHSELIDCLDCITRFFWNCQIELVISLV